jgi:two-component system sensor histidine kinase PilS (NtrC family)
VLALTGANGDLWGRLLVLKNLTSLIQMEAAVRKAEHLAAIGEMAAGLAHELRTPLASMTGAWHLLSGTEPPEPDDHPRLIGIIGREMERLAKLTNDFLSFARPARANPRQLDLMALAADQLNIFRHSKREGIRLEIRLNPVPPVFFDQDHFSQIIWNLLANAVEAGEKQAELHIIVETGLDQAWADYVVFRITNDGPGIPKEDLPKLFDPFFSTKSSGNGLGLATVSRLLNEGGGHITVSSTHQSSNLGLTTFSVFFPKADCLAEP